MKSNKGFLLLEVILSVLLISGGLLIITQSFSVSKKMLFQSRELFHSALLLRESVFLFEERGSIDETQKGGRWLNEPWAWDLGAFPVEGAELERVEFEVFAPGKPGTGWTVETYLRKKTK